MSEAPERIWAWWDDTYDVGLLNKHGDKRYTPNDAKEYVRADRIKELEVKLAKAEVLQEAQKLFNYYAVEIVTYGATVARLQNLENAWLNLKTQAELTGGKDE